MRRTAIVTGGSGIVGRATVAGLCSDGWRVITMGRSAPPIDGMEWLHIDLATSQVPAYVTEMADAIVHLAAAVPHAAEYPDNDASAALTERMDAAVLSAARARDVPVVYASTCGLYDRSDPSWKSEDSSVTATSPYFRAKLYGENQFLDRLSTAMIIRLSAPFGPGLRRGLVLARFAEAARAGKALEVWGKGGREQDFLHTEDIADFIVAALAAPRQGIWNVAAGQPTTMLDLANTCVASAGRGRVEPSIRPDPSDGHSARYLTKAAKRDFSWQPSRKLVDWLTNYQQRDLL